LQRQSSRDLYYHETDDASPAPCHTHLISSVLLGEALIAAPTGLDLAPLKAATDDVPFPIPVLWHTAAARSRSQMPPGREYEGVPSRVGGREGKWKRGCFGLTMHSDVWKIGGDKPCIYSTVLVCINIIVPWSALYSGVDGRHTRHAGVSYLALPFQVESGEIWNAALALFVYTRVTQNISSKLLIDRFAVALGVATIIRTKIIEAAAMTPQSIQKRPVR